MDNQIQKSIGSFIWKIADDCLRDVYVCGKSWRRYSNGKTIQLY